jgi:hypothetical protein
MQRKLILLLGIVAVIAALTVACSDSDNGDDGDNGDDAAHASADNVAILSVLSTVSDANLHHVETTLNGDDPAIDPTWIAPIVHARTAAALIEWPEELHDAAQAFLDDSMPLLMALQEDDVEGAVAVSTQAHTSWHLLRDPGYAYLAEQAGTAAMSGDDGHDDGHDATATGTADDGHDDGTATATGTAEADDDNGTATATGTAEADDDDGSATATATASGS